MVQALRRRLATMFMGLPILAASDEAHTCSGLRRLNWPLYTKNQVIFPSLGSTPTAQSAIANCMGIPDF